MHKRSSMILWLAALLPIWCSLAVAQTVSTLPGQWDASGGLSMGPDGFLYMADFGPTLSQGTGSIVYRVSTSGSSEVFVTGVDGASGNGFDTEGNLYQSNIRGGVVWKIAPDGSHTVVATDIISPTGVGVDSQGNLFVASCRGFIHRIAPDGSSSVFLADEPLNCPNGLTIDDEDNIYTANFNDGALIKITPQGTPSLLATIPGANNGHVTFANNRLYVVARGGHQIYEVSLDGAVRLLAGSGARGKADGDALSASFSIPNGIAASVTGDTLFVNDAVPTTGNPMGVINPVVIRVIAGVRPTMPTKVEEDASQQGAAALHINAVYPNPVAGQLHIDFSSPFVTATAMMIYDVSGKNVKSVFIESVQRGRNVANIDVAQLVPGTYFYRLSQQDRATQGGFVVIH